MNDNSIKKILILAANPKNSTPLCLDAEVRDINEALKRSNYRDRFELEDKWAVRPKDLQREILDWKPQIVHFSGHGVGNGGLALEDETGQAKFVSTQAIAGLFKLFADRADPVECVLLNACYSEVQAVAIAQHITYVIGMKQAIGDDAARAFAVGFYDALGAGENIEFAFDCACNRIDMEGMPYYQIPVLFKDGKVIRGSAAERLEGSTGSSEERKFTLIPDPSPLPSISLEELGGQMPVDSPFYVERPPNEKDCFEAIVKPGALIRIKAPRQMGKSSLMLRILDRATKQGYRFTWLNLQAAGEQSLENLDNFLKWLCSRISRKLRREDRVEEYWQGALSCNDKCTDYFELYLLAELKVPFVLCLDEVDQLLQHQAVAGDFFGLLRSWQEESKFNPVWQNLRLIIAHSKEVYTPLNINQSPFNVGLTVNLEPLNDDQVADLIQRHGLSLMPKEEVNLIDLTGGHPYLLRVALYFLARREITLAQLMKNAATAECVYGDHLRHHLTILQEHPNLLAAMKRTISVENPVRINAAEAFELSSMGLVRFYGHDVVPLCSLYRQYFREMLDGCR